MSNGTTVHILSLRWFVHSIIHLSALFSLYDSWSTKSLKIVWFMMTSSNGKFFRVTDPLCGDVTGHRWIPLTKASDTELWYFLDLRRNKPLSNNPNADDLRRYRAHYDVTAIYRSRTRQLLIATIIKQPISRLFNRHESTKYGLSATFFRFFNIFLFGTKLKYKYPHPPQAKLIPFLLVYSRICACKLSLPKPAFHMYWNYWVSVGFFLYKQGWLTRWRLHRKCIR